MNNPAKINVIPDTEVFAEPERTYTDPTIGSLLHEMGYENGSEESDVAYRILHALEICPIVSSSMMQTALQAPAYVWRPVLEKLIEHKLVLKSLKMAPTTKGRHQTYTTYRLNGTPNHFGRLDLSKLEE